MQLFLDACGAVPDLGPLMPALLAALVVRMGHVPPLEPSEELRLQITELVARIVERAPARCDAVRAACGLQIRQPRARAASSISHICLLEQMACWLGLHVTPNIRPL